MSDVKREDLSPFMVNTVFISSTARDLRAFRQVVAHLQHLRFGVTESFPESEWSSVTTPNEIVAECHRRVMSADAFVLILGPWAGWIPPGYTESITHLEFRSARSRFAELRQSIDESAKRLNKPGLVELFRIPRILVLTAMADKRRRTGSDGGPALLRIEHQVRPLFAKYTKAELEGIKRSLEAFHQEVYQAVEGGEALLFDFNDMEDVQVQMLETMERWYYCSTVCSEFLYQ